MAGGVCRRDNRRISLLQQVWRVRRRFQSAGPVCGATGAATGGANNSKRRIWNIDQAMKTYRNLYAQIISFENLYLAFRKARKGKRSRPEVAAFELDLEDF